MGGYEGKRKFVYLKWASPFWLSIQNFIFPRGKFFWFWVGGWFGLAWWVRQITHPSPRVDEHIPDSALLTQGWRCSMMALVLKDLPC